MNLILLDYDVASQSDRIREVFEKLDDCRVHGIRDCIPTDISAGAPVKGILLTALNGGWMKYHTELAEQYPFVSHWIFCVVGKFGAVLKERIADQFASIADSDVYCELVFDDTDFSSLTPKLTEPVKVGKKCIVVSLNAELVEAVKEIIQLQLPEWTVEASVGQSPDYTLCDNVFIVGNTAQEMLIAKPEIRSVKSCFWVNTPYHKNSTDISVDKVLLGRQLNDAGWNIGDYSSLVFFSSLHHEEVYQQILREEMTPAALLADPMFVLWDGYGLPLVQSQLTEQELCDFLATHTVFQTMINRFCSNQKGRNRK